MNGEMRVISPQIFECVEITSGRKSRFRSRDVEPHHSGVAVTHRYFGDLLRTSVLTHRTQKSTHSDAFPLLGCSALTLSKPRLDRLDYGVQRQPLLGEQLGRVPHLGVDHTVRREVLRAFGSHPDQRFLCLHHPAGVREGLEIGLERTRVGGVAKPAAQRVDVGGGQCAIAGDLGELDHGARTQTTVQVIME
jgi:hypothetical protein